MTLTTISWLDTVESSEWSAEPFFDLTVELLRSVRDHDFDTLANLCDDDFGIVDLDQSVNNVMIRTRAEWEAWFHRLFSELDAVGAATDSEITNYNVMAGRDLAFSVVEFQQTLSIGELQASFDCVTTIVWKATPDGWKEARWHVSVLDSDVPPELAA